MDAKLRKALFLTLALALCKGARASQIVNPPNFDVTTATATNLVTKNINGTFIGLGRNRVLNGDMRFDQNNEGSSYSSSGGMAHYGLDQWRYEGTGISTFSITRVSDVSPLVSGLAAFPFAMRVVTVSSGTIGSSVGANMEYPMDPVYQEDWGWGTSYASPVTVSFWALCSSSGVFTFAALNGVDSRSYVTTYTLPSANTWTHLAITIPGDTTAPYSNWPSSGAVFGFKAVWDLGSGSAVTTSSTNTWQAAAVWKASGSSSVSSLLASWYLTGVQIELGTQASDFEYVPYSQELFSIQRYFFKTFPQGTPCLSGQGSTGAPRYVAQQPGLTAGGGVYIQFPAPMISIPGTVSTYSTIVGGGNSNWYNITAAAQSGVPVDTSPGPTGVFITNPQVAGDSGGDVIGIHVCVSGQLGGP